MPLPPPPVTPLEIGFVRRVLGPALLIAAMPILVVIVWMINARFDGSIVRFVREIDAATFVRLVPRPTLAAAGILVAWVVLQAGLLLGLPGKTFLGPVTPAGARPR